MIKWLAALLLMPSLAFGQSLVNCMPNIPCTTAGAPAVANEGDKAWLAFGKTNANDTFEFAALNTLTNRNTLINVRDYGAVCDGVTDDSAAFSSAVAQVNSKHVAGTDVGLYIPAGRCVINNAITQFAAEVPGYVQGDGAWHTVLLIRAGLTGSVFSWDEAWGATGSGLPTHNFSNAWNGAGIVGVTLLANSNSGAQTGLLFLDRNDNVLVRDVDIWNFNGSAISIGQTKTKTQGYMRESRFSSVRVFFCGSSTAPAVDISSTTTNGSDATNELKWYALDIFDSNGVGLSVTNKANFSATRAIMFFGLRVENAQGAYDLVRIGDTTNNGPVSQISFFGLAENSVPAAAVGFHIANTTNNLYSITVDDFAISTGTGVGVKIDAGHAIKFTDVKIAATLTPALQVAASPPVGCCIWFENTFVGAINTTIDPTSAAIVYESGGDGWNFTTLGNETANSVFTTAHLNIPSTTTVGCPLNGIVCPMVGQQAYAWSGNLTGTGNAGPFSAMWYQITTDTFANTNANGLVSAMQIDHFFGGKGAKGGFSGLDVNLSTNAGPTANSGGQYTVGTFAGRLNYNDNGWANTYIGAAGTIFGLNPNIGVQCNGGASNVQPCGTNTRGMVGMEIDMAAYNHTSLLTAIGIQIVKTGFDVSLPSEENIGYTLSDGPGASGWDLGYGIGNFDGNFPMTAAGTILGCYPHAGLGLCGTTANGINLTNITFTGSPFKSINFNVDPVGNVAAPSFAVGAGGVSAQTAVFASIGITNPGQFIGRSSFPGIFIDAPETGGVQAVASIATEVLNYAQPLTIGVGASDGDVLTLTGGAGTQATVTIGIGSFTGSINGSNLTVSGSVTGTPLALGQLISDGGVNIAAGTYITSGSGTAWLVSVQQTVASQSMTAFSDTITTPGSYTGVAASPGTTGGTASVQPTFTFGFGIGSMTLSNAGSNYPCNPLPTIRVTNAYVTGDLPAVLTPTMTCTTSQVIMPNGATISGAITTINANQNFGVNIGTGSNTQTVTVGGGSNAVTVNGTTVTIQGAVQMNVGLNNNVNIDTGTSTGTVNIGSGTGNNAINIGNGTGKISMKGPLLSAAGTQFTVASGTGACATTSTLNGGVQAGDFVCTGTTGASTATLTLAATTAAYACWGRDITTPTTVTQTGAKSTTSVTLTLTSVTANDVVQFGCLGY